MVVDSYREAFIRAQLLQKDIMEGIQGSCWHVVGLREKGRKKREREREGSALI